MRILAAAFLFSLCSVSTGYELANFEFTGFSEDGEFLAWEQWGTYDGSGFPYSQVTVMRVPDNTVLEVYSTVIDLYEPFPVDQLYGTDTTADDPELLYEQTARSLTMASAQDLLDSLGIAPGNTGRLCVHRPLTDVSAHEPVVRFVTGMFGPDYPAGPVFELALENREAAGLDEDTMLMWVVPPVTLYLALTESGTGNRTVLLDETGTDDESLYCYGYGLRDVIVWQDRYVVVVLRRSVPGFEGPDVRYRVVTGELPEASPGWEYSSTG